MKSIRRSARSSSVASKRLTTWREHHLWCLRASMRRLARRPLGTLMTVLVMGFALALPLLFWWLVGNVQQVEKAMTGTQALNVFLQQKAGSDQVERLREKWATLDGVVRVDIVTPDEGLKTLAHTQGFTGALDLLDHNPLPYVMVVVPRKGMALSAFRKLTTQLTQNPLVEQVQDNMAWRERLHSLTRVGWRLMWVLTLLLSLAAVLVIGNSIRLDIQGRVDEINVLKLIGASFAFIRRPYLYAGLWYGIVSGVVACIIVLVVQLWLSGPINELVVKYGGQIRIQSLSVSQFLLAPCFSALLGWLGARLAGSYWLRQKH